MERNELKSILESLLFVSGEPVKSAKLAKICGVAVSELENAAAELAAEYENGRGLRLIVKSGQLQLATASENSAYVNQLVSGELNAELSRSALETLAIVAYRGPITRVQIEAIRGVNCTYVLRSLAVRGLVERKESAGNRGYLYDISFDFLKHIGVTGRENLPDWKFLSKNEKIESLLETQAETKNELAQNNS